MPRMIDADNLTHILEEWEEKACDGTENDGSDGTTRVLHPVPTTTREMIDLIADQPTIAPPIQWISVSERLPNKTMRCLVYGSGGGIYTAEFIKSGDWHKWHKLNSKNHYCNPTHWMPLPEPPSNGLIKRTTGGLNETT